MWSNFIVFQGTKCNNSIRYLHILCQRKIAKEQVSMYWLFRDNPKIQCFFYNYLIH